MAQVQFEKLLSNPRVRNIAIGIGLTVLVPLAAKFLAPLVRPLARSSVKIGLVAIEKGRETAAEIGEIFDDLVAEVREEMRAEHEPADDLMEDAETALEDTSGAIEPPQRNSEPS